MAGLPPEISRKELDALFDQKYRGAATLGSDPARRLRWGYFTPDDHYEALVRRMVTAQSRWLDVGCGRDLFPSNRALARELSGRCASLVGVDPDLTIQENPFVHHKVQGFVEDLDPGLRFDLVTMRMVAEHVAEPRRLLDALGRLVLPGGFVVIYTINRWSPVPLVTAATPFAWHHPAKRMLWRTEAKDTFPTTYKMNTRRELTKLLDASGFEETAFWYLDDCRSFQRFELLNVMELSLWSLLQWIGLRYPETCLLGLYRRLA